jgi:3-deoxy-D-arabino-heptulosonate 7-phosphate (DAHP) synthase
MGYKLGRWSKWNCNRRIRSRNTSGIKSLFFFLFPTFVEEIRKYSVKEAGRWFYAYCALHMHIIVDGSHCNCNRKHQHQYSYH